MRAVTIDEALNAAGTGAFQRRLFLIFGLVWTADAMQVLSIGFTAPSIAKTFGLSLPVALQTGTIFFVGMLIGAALFGRLADRIGRRNLLIVTVLIDALFGLASAFASERFPVPPKTTYHPAKLRFIQCPQSSNGKRPKPWQPKFVSRPSASP